MFSVGGLCTYCHSDTSIKFWFTNFHTLPLYYNNDLWVITKFGNNVLFCTVTTMYFTVLDKNSTTFKTSLKNFRIPHPVTLHSNLGKFTCMSHDVFGWSSSRKYDDITRFKCGKIYKTYQIWPPCHTIQHTAGSSKLVYR